MARKTKHAVFREELVAPASRTSKVFFTAFRQWRADGMEATRMQFADIGAASVVFDVGGFQGNWAADIHDRYRVRVHVFEPHPTFAEALRTPFQRNDAIIIHNFALGRSESYARKLVTR